MTHLILYTRHDCHLCDEAEELIAAVAPQAEIEKVDIEPELALVHRYGLRIPVIRRADSGAELDWPTDAEGLRQFLAA